MLAETKSEDPRIDNIRVNSGSVDLRFGDLKIANASIRLDWPTLVYYYTKMKLCDQTVL